MNIDKAVRKEEEELERLYNEGKISHEHLQKELKYLYQDARGAIEEDAQKAYDDVMGGYRKS